MHQHSGTSRRTRSCRGLWCTRPNVCYLSVCTACMCIITCIERFKYSGTRQLSAPHRRTELCMHVTACSPGPIYTNSGRNPRRGELVLAWSRHGCRYLLNKTLWWTADAVRQRAKHREERLVSSSNMCTLVSEAKVLHQQTNKPTRVSARGRI